MTATASSLFSVVRNSGLFSGHWLEHRLNLEPEWEELKEEASHALEQLVKLWKTEKKRVEKYGDEQGLEQAFIQPVFRELGWKFKYQTFLDGREPDYALFQDDASLQAAIDAGRNSPNFWSTASVVADAKAWHIPLDKPSNVNGKKEYPPQQIEWYLDRSRLTWGILTNGKHWRLVPRTLESHQRRFETYLEIDLPRILDEGPAQFGVLEEFLHFYIFFGPAGHRATNNRQPLIQRAVLGSTEYRLGVSEGLKDQTFRALSICIEGLLAWKGNRLQSDRDLALCREEAFILLCRLLFIMYAEDRRLLPYRVNKNYTENRSLGRLRDEVGRELDLARQGVIGSKEFQRDSVKLWDDVQSLFDLIDGGGPRYGVPAYNGGLFDTETHRFLAEMKIDDWHLARVIDSLGRAPDPERPAVGLFRVDYRDLAIQHLGGIYEGLLEVHPHVAKVDMHVYSRREKGVYKEIVVPATAAAPEGYERTTESYIPGTIYLVTDKRERRNFGSYYTPDHIVEAIVRRTLGAACEEISTRLDAEIAETTRRVAKEKDKTKKETLAAELERLQRTFGERALQLRVVDPAMGSGHFLLYACQFLAEEIATNPHTDDTMSGEDEAAVSYWKRRVIENCIYGVDINPLAVELAKLALWLETVAAERPLTFLDHHLRFGNSLIGAKVAALGSLPGDKHLFSNAYGDALAGKLPAILKPLAEIRSSPSERLAQAKEKEKRFEAYEKAASAFQCVADVWCASATGEDVSDTQYRGLLEVLDKPAKFKAAADEDWCRETTQRIRATSYCFHWSLAFPEVFFNESGPLEHPGFDVLIGNPPYEVLAEKESGTDLTALRSFIDAEPDYAPSVRGKNNLYKLFICRALDLLAEGGRFGFIVPMPLLGDEQAVELRRNMVDRGSFTSVEAFPQKDNPAKRVFPEAKLSTAVFTYVKGKNAVPQSFTSRVHPAQFIDEQSPSLQLSTAEIPLYDPSNFTIVSCSQADWDLATRIMQSGRMERLKESAEFFQGEVNETNERSKGNFSTEAQGGKLVTRGASICLYVLRPASQGADLYLNVTSFLHEKGKNTKAFHHRFNRIGLQESCPQNNFRRIIAAFVGAGNFCNHKVNYLPEHTSQHPLEFALALLNTRLADWYFRLGSSNAAVSHYQLYNLPCPVFAKKATPDSEKALEKALSSLAINRTDKAIAVLEPFLKRAPFNPIIRDVIVAAVKRIIAVEEARGKISRTDRSSLDPAAQPYQDFIDQLFYGMAGLTAKEVEGLEERYAKML